MYKPNVSWIVLKPLTRLRELAQAIVINFTAGKFEQSLLWKRQPISNRDSTFQIKPKPGFKEGSTV